MNSKEYTFVYEPIPTINNVEYVFQRLLLSVIESTGFQPYEKSHDEYKKIAPIIIKWVIEYANTKDLLLINWDEFVYIRQQLFKLDSNNLSVDGLYSEEAYEWILQLQILLEKIKKGDCKNGI